MIYTYIRDVRIGDDDSYNAPQLLYGDYAAQHNRWFIIYIMIADDDGETTH